MNFFSDTKIQVKQKMSISTPRRCKSIESAQRQVSLRKSVKKRSIPQASQEFAKTPESRVTVITPEVTFETPKNRIRCKSIKLDKSSKESKSKNSEKVCSFYRKTIGPNGDMKFSPSLIKYFMKIDSPESKDLRLKRFNTSFRRERPTNRDSLKIFTEEEMNDETRSIQKNVHITPPGSKHADVFASLPSIDFDFDLKQGKNKRKSVSRCTPFKGKPLPDEHLLFDKYSSLFHSESN